MDAEGYDPGVIRGAMELLKRGSIRVLVFEYHAIETWEFENLDDILISLSQNANMDCWLLQHGFAVLLTGCWTADWGKSWSNVLCVKRSDFALHTTMVGFMP